MRAHQIESITNQGASNLPGLVSYNIKFSTSARKSLRGSNMPLITSPDALSDSLGLSDMNADESIKDYCERKGLVYIDASASS